MRLTVSAKSLSSVRLFHSALVSVRALSRSHDRRKLGRYVPIAKTTHLLKVVMSLDEFGHHFLLHWRHFFLEEALSQAFY